jgi:hypothetical protein
LGEPAKLARYTHSVAISNHRLLGMADGKVTFRWRDYAHGRKQRKMTLAAENSSAASCSTYSPRAWCASATTAGWRIATGANALRSVAPCWGTKSRRRLKLSRPRGNARSAAERSSLSR